MAFLRRLNVTQAFRNNQQLQQFVLPGVTPTGVVLGTGSYGTVEEVKKGKGGGGEIEQGIHHLYTLGNIQASLLCWQETP